MLQLIDIKKAYKTASLEQQVLKGVSLSLRDNEFVAILGASGSGKTTLLNIIGGLDRYDSGELIINGISTKQYGSRDWDSYRNHTVGFVFQSYNLIPHQTLLSNVELALTIGGISRAERVQRAKDALTRVGLAEHMYKKPSQISGGQMQRVAIARALVNDPDILLADEPTGALDSDTSLQVMDLLKEVAKDRLVVMVTHNAELAETYATRIVRLKDGTIEDDTDPFAPDAGGGEPAVHKNMGKSSMSLLTALALSFNNLWTKKARTILVALAGSIGIIGIALIMSLSNGVNRYVADIEAEALQNYPLTITDTSFQSALMAAMMGDETDMGGEADPDDAEPAGEADGEASAEQDVREIPMLSGFFEQMVTNDLGALRAYFESGESDIYDNVQAIEYNYNIVPQIYLEQEAGVRQINPDQSFSALGFSSGSGGNALWSAFSSSDSFFALPGNGALYQNGYDVKAGRWPEDYRECVVVLSSRGAIADMCLYAIGLKDPAELDKMVQAFADGTEIEVKESDAAYEYADFLGRSFKVVSAAEMYTYDADVGVWVNHGTDAKYLAERMKTGDDLTIVGVVQPSEDNASPLLNMGIGYPASLIEHLIEDAADSELVQAQLADPETNVLTGLPFGEEKGAGDLDLGSLFSVDMDAIAKAFSFDPGAIDLSKLNLPDIDLSDVDLSGLNADDISLEQILERASQTVITREELAEIFRGVTEGFRAYAEANVSEEGLSPALLGEYLQTEEGSAALRAAANALVERTNLNNILKDSLQPALDKVMQTLSEAVQTRLRQSMSVMAAGLAKQAMNAFRFDADALENAFQFAMSMDDLTSLMMSMYATEDSSYESNLRKFGYADKDKPDTITIYPLDFEAKGRVKDIIDGYNEAQRNAGADEKVIAYTDAVGMLMGSVTDIIDVVRDVLIAFISISLVVSSVMIGVITYISVLERQKEIGIMRAIGSSTRNISEVFNAETFITGALAGLFGVGITYAALPPINALIRSLTDANVRASLPVTSALGLIALSIVLTLIGGIIPSMKAAKSDPVAALRSE